MLVDPTLPKIDIMKHFNQICHFLNNWACFSFHYYKGGHNFFLLTGKNRVTNFSAGRL